MNAKNGIDVGLATHGVSFLPWIGDHYQAGYKGKRLLVLGESHYRYESEEEGRALSDPFPPAFTRECVAGVITREGWVGNFWKYIEQAHLNAERWEMADAGEEFWHSIAFYNFVQVPVGTGPRQRPLPEEFKGSWRGFKAVLEMLKPERIVVCGKELWSKMADTPEELFLHDAVQGYYLEDGNVAWCLATVHPSSGSYSWRRLHPIIDAFISDPKEAVRLLAQAT